MSKHPQGLYIDEISGCNIQTLTEKSDSYRDHDKKQLLVAPQISEKTSHQKQRRSYYHLHTGQSVFVVYRIVCFYVEH